MDVSGTRDNCPIPEALRSARPYRTPQDICPELGDAYRLLITAASARWRTLIEVRRGGNQLFLRYSFR